MSEFKKILITGGMGFIGSNFIRYMLKKYPNYKIINLDKLTYAGNPENLRDVENNENYKFVKGDICDTKIVGELMPKCDYVINFAAETHVDRAIRDAGEFIKTDVYGTFVLLEFARREKIKKFVQISTDEVYGSVPEGKSSKEIDPLMPRNPYSASKAGGDRLAYSYFATYGVPVVITRASNNFGPYQYPEKLIPLFVTNLLQGKKVPLYGDGKNVRDWLYVLDNCRAIDLIMHGGGEGEVYNISGRCEKQNIEVTRIILNLLGKDESMIEYVPDRLGHDRRYSMDSTKIEKELGWKPRFKFENAMKETVEWYANNKWWWRALL